MNISELNEQQLNCAVAIVEGLSIDEDHIRYWKRCDGYGLDNFLIPLYCTTIAGDDIIDREKIKTYCPPRSDRWAAMCRGRNEYGPDHYGPTRRIAAMRAYVASRQKQYKEQLEKFFSSITALEQAAA